MIWFVVVVFGSNLATLYERLVASTIFWSSQLYNYVTHHIKFQNVFKELLIFVISISFQKANKGISGEVWCFFDLSHVHGPGRVPWLHVYAMYKCHEYNHWVF